MRGGKRKSGGLQRSGFTFANAKEFKERSDPSFGAKKHISDAMGDWSDLKSQRVGGDKPDWQLMEADEARMFLDEFDAAAAILAGKGLPQEYSPKEVNFLRTCLKCLVHNAKTYEDVSDIFQQYKNKPYVCQTAVATSQAKLEGNKFKMAKTADMLQEVCRKRVMFLLANTRDPDHEVKSSATVLERKDSPEEVGAVLAVDMKKVAEIEKRIIEEARAAGQLKEADVASKDGQITKVPVLSGEYLEKFRAEVKAITTFSKPPTMPVLPLTSRTCAKLRDVFKPQGFQDAVEGSRLFQHINEFKTQHKRVHERMFPTPPSAEGALLKQKIDTIAAFRQELTSATNFRELLDTFQTYKNDAAIESQRAGVLSPARTVMSNSRLEFLQACQTRALHLLAKGQKPTTSEASQLVDVFKKRFGDEGPAREEGLLTCSEARAMLRKGHGSVYFDIFHSTKAEAADKAADVELSTVSHAGAGHDDDRDAVADERSAFERS